MSQQLLNKYGPILSHYHIFPEYIEERKKIKKVYSQGKVFALKEADIKMNRHYSFHTILEKLEGKGYKNAIPIFHTIENQKIVVTNDRFYYLMPWIEERYTNISGKQSDVLEELAYLHSTTVETHEVNLEQIEKKYQSLLKKSENRMAVFQTFLDKCESKVYMSPFELFYCLHFTQVMRLETLAKEKLESWYAEIKNESETRYVLCHGKASASHLVNAHDNERFLINFERSYLGSPEEDLIYFYRRTFYFHPYYIKQSLKDFNSYRSYFALKDHEQLIFSFFLMQTDSIHRSIYQYQEQNSSLSELEKVRKLQKEIWMLQSSHEFIRQLEDSEKNPT